MPTLDWIGKKEVVNHHRKVPFHLLKKREDLSCGDANSGNLLVQADNLLGLKALLPYYAGQVKCIYIDPPYNTGNEGWIYNDNVNSPEMKNWLGKVVGKEAEDLTRHDKWLCMMYPRLQLLSEFLSRDGVIFVSIDDNESHSLRFVMDEIFGKTNFLCTFAWEKRYAPPPDTKDIGYLHETIIAYRKSSGFKRNLLELTPKQTGRYKNPDDDPRGPWKAENYTCRYTSEERPNLYYPVKQPFTGKDVWPKKTRVWAMSKDVHLQNERENKIWWGKNGKNKVPALKNFLSKVQQGMMPVTLLKYEVVGHTDEAAKELRALVPGVKFTPKPSRLIRHLLQIASDQNSIVLDAFSGSGTTGHAVLAQNKADKGNRKFILVEMEKRICNEITSERLSKAIGGYSNEPGLGGGFSYCVLGSCLFDQNGQIKPEVTYENLARHIFFTETGNPMSEKASNGYPLLGINNGIAVYLLFNGVLDDKRPNSGNILTIPVLKCLPAHNGPKVIYGIGCRIGESRLKQEGITFHQIPYSIKVS